MTAVTQSGAIAVTRFLQEFNWCRLVLTNHREKERACRAFLSVIQSSRQRSLPPCTSVAGKAPFL
jgi:hypothetical protein